VEKVGNSLKEDLTKPGYKSKHESTKCSAWLEWDSENGIMKNGIRKKKKNGIRKTGLGKMRFGKNGIQPSSRSSPARQKLDHLCLCFAVPTPELQARVCMPRVDMPDLFLFVAKMAIICRKMWKKWAIL